MRLVVFGGAGFVGLHVVEAALRAGHDVVIFDRRLVSAAFRQAMGVAGARFDAVVGDVGDADAVRAVLGSGADAVVYGAAVTGGASRDAADPEGVLATNLNGLVAVLRAARDAGVGRFINLSSVGALGRAVGTVTMITEELQADPVSLYSITKFAGERAVERLGALWSLDAVSLRLSAVYGPWEHATGVRDSLSPHAQIRACALMGRPALLAREGTRDWVHGADVGSAVLRVLCEPQLQYRLYNVTAGVETTALAFGKALAQLWPGLECRLVRNGEVPTIDLHLAVDRPPLSPERLVDELGWQATVDVETAAAGMAPHSSAWTVSP